MSSDAPEINIALARVGGDIAASARQAEDVGFDGVHCGEHLFFHGPTPNALVALAVAAGATTRLKLLTSVVVLPLYPAALVAKMASVLDLASEGRFRLGIGVGGEYPPEFDAVGVPVAERGRRTDEALEIITRLFREPSVSFDGRWATLRDIGLQPRPSSSGPPIWVAGRRHAAQRRAGRWGAAWMPYMCTPEQLADGLITVRETAASVGRDPDAVDGSVWVFITVDSDGGRARRVACETVSGFYRQDFSRLQHYLVAGTPSECVARLREYHDAGAASIQLTLACAEQEQEQERMFRLIAEAVLPPMRER